MTSVIVGKKSTVQVMSSNAFTGKTEAVIVGNKRNVQVSANATAGIIDTTTPVTLKNTGIKINDKDVFEISNIVRGLHAVAYSNKGAKDFLNFSENYKTYEYIDMILELYTIKNPAIVVRSDLESYISGHYGIFFQDRNKFPSTI